MSQKSSIPQAAKSVSHVLMSDKGKHSNLTRSLGNALRGAQRAAALTSRLLAFSRRQALNPKAASFTSMEVWSERVRVGVGGERA
ncbi:MAG: hypothetical protein PVSMB3_13690 [Candidatus Dormibacteraceae bacterium]